MNRRDFLRQGALTAAFLGISGNFSLISSGRGSIALAAGKEMPLPIPPILEDGDTESSLVWYKLNANVKERRFIMETMGRGMGMRRSGGRLSINGKRMSLNRVDETVKAATNEIWEIENRSGMMMSVPHSMHLHDVQFYILSRDNAPPEPHERGRKDTVLVMPGETVRILVPFGTYKGVYMYHCHMLEHEDDGMMGQFEVI